MHIKLFYKLFDNQLAFLLVLTTFSYPFFFRNLNTSIYSIIFNGTLLLTFSFLSIILIKKYPFKINTSFLHKKELLLFLSFYIFYVIAALVVTTQYYLENGNGLKEMLSWIRNLIIVMIIFIFISSSMLKKLLEYYVSFIVILSLSAIILSILIYYDTLHPIQQIDINGQMRDLYIFGYRWSDSWLGDRYNIVRLQSFTDEAGTMAFAIIPALLLSHMQQKYIKLSVMFIALCLTFSVGAIIPITIIILFYIFKNRHYKLLFIFIVFSTIIALYLNVYFHEYLSAKLGSGGDTSSVSIRFYEAKTALTALANHISGLGISSLQQLDIALAIGWIVPLIYFGIIPYIFYILAFLSLLVLLIKDLFSPYSLNRFLALIILILYYASLQRTQIDYNVWHWAWIIIYIRLRTYHTKGNHDYRHYNHHLQ